MNDVDAKRHDSPPTTGRCEGGGEDEHGRPASSKLSAGCEHGYAVEQTVLVGVAYSAIVGTPITGQQIDLRLPSTHPNSGIRIQSEIGCHQIRGYSTPTTPNKKPTNRRSPSTLSTRIRESKFNLRSESTKSESTTPNQKLTNTDKDIVGTPTASRQIDLRQ